MSDEDRAKLCDWLRLHGVDPDVVPEDATIERDLATGTWRIDVLVTDSHGDPVETGSGFVRQTVTFAVRAPWPLELSS